MKLEYSHAAKPVIVDGVRYDSKLEAQWGLWMRLLGWPIEPHPEKIMVDGKEYAPDFKLYTANGIPSYIEVKPTIEAYDPFYYKIARHAGKEDKRRQNFVNLFPPRKERLVWLLERIAYKEENVCILLGKSLPKKSVYSTYRNGKASPITEEAGYLWHQTSIFERELSPDTPSFTRLKLGWCKQCKRISFSGHMLNCILCDEIFNCIYYDSRVDEILLRLFKKVKDKIHGYA